MAKKKKTETEVQKFSKEEIQAALDICYSEFFMQVIALQSHDPKIKELNYVKVPVVTPQGGTYLISILHVDGPKLDLSDLTKNALEFAERSK